MTRIAPQLLGVILACALLEGSCRGEPGDRDHDGIPDDVEEAQAQQLFPVVHVSGFDACPEPIGPKPVLFRARHPSFRGIRDEDYLVINYVFLYDADCGAAPHPGDDEAVVVFARRSTNQQYAFESIAASAHANTAAELRTSAAQRDLWIEPDKHSHFAQYANCFGCDRKGSSWGVALFNVGEPEAPLLSDLGVVRPAYQGINPWSTATRFLGAGVIGSDGLTLRFFDYLTRPPAFSSCVRECPTQSCVSACRTSSWRWDD